MVDENEFENELRHEYNTLVFNALANVEYQLYNKYSDQIPISLDKQLLQNAFDRFMNRFYDDLNRGEE